VRRRRRSSLVRGAAAAHDDDIRTAAAGKSRSAPLSRRNGHDVPDATGGARERRCRAFPAVLKAPRVPPLGSARLVPEANAELLDAFALHLATRAAHTRAAYVRDVAKLCALAGEKSVRTL